MSTDLLADFIRVNQTDALGVYGIHAQPADGSPMVHRMRSDDRVNLYSVSKGFTAVALGLAEAEGRLTRTSLGAAGLAVAASTERFTVRVISVCPFR